MSTGKGKGVHESQIGNIVEAVGKPPVGMGRQPPSYSLDVLGHCRLARVGAARQVGRISLGDAIARLDLLFVGEARHLHRDARRLALGIADHMCQWSRCDRRVRLAAFAIVERADADGDHAGQQCNALHRYLRIASRYRLYKNETSSSTAPSTVIEIVRSPVFMFQTSTQSLPT